MIEGSVRIPLRQNSATYSSVTTLPLLFAMLLDLWPFASFFIPECSVTRSSLYNYDHSETHHNDLRTKSERFLTTVIFYPKHLWHWRSCTRHDTTTPVQADLPLRRTTLSNQEQMSGVHNTSPGRFLVDKFAFTDGLTVKDPECSNETLDGLLPRHRHRAAGLFG